MKQRRRKHLSDLRSKARRRCMRLLARVQELDGTFVHCNAGYRDAQRLWRAGLIVVVQTKARWFKSKRKFRELGLFPAGSEAEQKRFYRAGAVFAPAARKRA